MPRVVIILTSISNEVKTNAKNSIENLASFYGLIKSKPCWYFYTNNQQIFYFLNTLNQLDLYEFEEEVSYLAAIYKEDGSSGKNCSVRIVN